MTCAQAASAHEPYGCDFWPTVTRNQVWSIFDFAVLVTNPGTASTTVTVTRNGAPVTSQNIAGGHLGTIYLPWVPALKGPDADSCSATTAAGSSVRVDGGAYHLTSTRPVAVYQFNAYEYKGAGGPTGKDWSSCPGNQVCSTNGTPIGCYSFSNDASLLLPSSSLGTTYRITGLPAWTAGKQGPYTAITATADGTHVTVKLSAKADVVAGSGVQATSAGGTLQLSLAAGDVVSLLGSTSSDSSGTLVSSDKPIQVIAGMSCTQAPFGTQACDHVEQSVLPVNEWGRDYLVAVPAGPAGKPIGHVVRLYGQVDNTKLSYPSGTPPTGAPTTLSAGQVVGLGVVNQDFEVRGDQPFGVISILPGGTLLDPNAPAGNAEGDPSQSFVVPIGQYRKSYRFGAASGYDATFLDVIIRSGTTLLLDGSVVSATITQIGSTAYSSLHIPLGAGTGLMHTLTGTAPFSVQVTGYGRYTSYRYPAGPDLRTLP